MRLFERTRAGAEGSKREGTNDGSLKKGMKGALRRIKKVMVGEKKESSRWEERERIQQPTEKFIAVRKDKRSEIRRRKRGQKEKAKHRGFDDWTRKRGIFYVLDLGERWGGKVRAREKSESRVKESSLIDGVEKKKGGDHGR